MLKRIFILLLGLSALKCVAQKNPFEDQSWNFGEVAFWNNDTAWFTVRNVTDKNLVFLPTYYNEDLQIFFSNRAASPNESITIGIVYYTQIKGKFNVEVPLYINLRGEPIHFHLKGTIKSFDPMAQLRCPIVNGGTDENQIAKVVTVEVRDLETDQLLLPDELGVKARNNQRVKIEKDDSVFRMSVLPGAYRVSCIKAGYHEYFAAINLEPYQLKYVVYLETNEEVPMVDVIEEEEPALIEYIPIADDTNKVDIVEVKGDAHIHEEIRNKDTTSTAETTGLSSNEYKFNNVIVIVDVSSSMNRGGKLDGLKTSFGYMVDALRPEDRICIISMASQAVVVQEPVGVYQPDSLKARMANMKASGGTNGGAAIQLAYQLATQNFMADGNNQVIIATDGVFYGGTLTRKQMEELIGKGNANNIHLSTVAFGSDPKALLFLSHLAEIGGGNAIQIANPADSQTQLLEMIKSQSRR
ncbi:MAG: VWA domain-containing protein [Bacteroidia bacterium]|nr:VWA domain-containing protein [Bacteroidia bacterium]